MRHRVGSLSKTFTSVALMQQVERGRIGLDAPVADYVPDLFEGSGADRERGDAITTDRRLRQECSPPGRGRGPVRSSPRSRRRREAVTVVRDDHHQVVSGCDAKPIPSSPPTGT